MMGFPTPIGFSAFEAARLLSEGTRQSDMGAALAAFKAGGTQRNYDAAVRAADIAHHRRLATAAQQNGVASDGPRHALRDLGAA
jgi:hypothetical protein